MTRHVDDKATRGHDDRAAVCGFSLSTRRLASPSLRCRCGAFTLPEVLATMVLVGLVLPSVMKGVSLSLSAAGDARKRMEAVSLAEQKLAEISASATSTSAGTTAGDFGTDRGADYRWEATVSNVENELSEIRVRVSWTARGAPREVGLSTLTYTGLSSGSLGTSTTPGGSGGTGGGGPSGGGGGGAP